MEIITIAQVKLIMGERFNAEPLKEIYKGAFEDFIVKHHKALKKAGAKIPSSLYAVGKKYTKSSVLDGILAPFTTKKTFELFRKEGHEGFIKALDVLIFEGVLQYKTFEKLSGLLTLEEKQMRVYGSYQYVKTTKPAYKLFATLPPGSYHYRIRSIDDLHYAMPGEIRMLIQSYYPRPENTKIKTYKTPVDAPYIYNTGEKDILQEWSRIKIYRKQGEIKYSSKGKPNKATLNKMQRKLKLAAFYPKETEKENHLLRTRLLAGIVHAFYSNDNKGVHFEIKKFYDSLGSNDYEDFYCIFDHLKGSSYIDFYWYEEGKSHISSLKRMLSQLPNEEWTDTESIWRASEYEFLPFEIIDPHHAQERLYHPVDMGRYTQKKYVNGNIYPEVVEKTTLFAYLYILGALGILNLAMDIPSEKDKHGFPAPYSGLKAIQLTPLGMFVLGRVKSYTPKTNENAGKINLSDHALSISFIGDDTGDFETRLTPFAEKITDKLYQVTYSSFLHDCKNLKDAETKVTLFKQIISSKLPKNWDDFFKSLKTKSKPLGNETSITVFSLSNTKDKELIRLLATDPKLKTLIHKAEGFHILVARNNLSAFKKRMKEFGYLV